MNALYLPVMFFLCHLIGDYLTQSDWMALNKSKKTLNCLVHCVLYTICFLMLTLLWKALLFIGITHFIFDRFPIIIKRLIWIKNHINPTLSYPPFKYCDTTGYYDESPINTNQNPYCVRKNEQSIWKETDTRRPFYITIWLYIITDNMVHLVCNLLALMLFS